MRFAWLPGHATAETIGNTISSEKQLKTPDRTPKQRFTVSGSLTGSTKKETVKMCRKQSFVLHNFT